MKLTVKENIRERIDIYLAKELDMSRSKVKNQINNANILVNDKQINANYIIKENDVISVEIVDENINVDPEEMNLDIIYEDDDLLVINKPSGLVVHPAVGNYNHTMVNGLLYYLNNENKNNSIRPGIVHRLDKDTSGLMLVAKNDYIHDKLSEMIKNKEVERVYVVLVWGIVKHDRGTIDAPIGRDENNRQKYAVTSLNSKESITHFTVIERLNEVTLLQCKLDTGRTHQIRVHLNYINHPVVNDPVYCNKKPIDEKFGQMLHSKYIRFVHPRTKKELTFEVNPPKEFDDILNMFKY